MSIKHLIIILLAAGFAACSGGGPSGAARSNGIHIIPLPSKVTLQPDSFLLDKQTVIVATTPATRQIAALFNAYFKELGGFELKVSQGAERNAIIISADAASAMKETYSLDVKKDLITIDGEDAAGAFYGMQTLLQLIAPQEASSYWIPGVSIYDHPRFAYRGLHLDVCRHFFPVEFIKKYIDLLAMHKMNTFHWHLTDDQGWRIEIKKYPRLQEVASRRKETMEGHYNEQRYDRKPYGGFYTQEDIKEIVRYAAERYVTIIPEIEMPGHALAALAAYPELGCTGGPYEVGTRWGVYDDVFCAGNDSVFTFLQHVLQEVMLLFPGKYIHIGGDECPKVRWEHCPKCKRRMQQEGIRDGHMLQSYFIRRMEKFLNANNRQIIGWDEILEGGLAPNATVMSWRGTEGGIAAAKQHHDVVMTPQNYVYLDYYQSRGKNEPVAIGGFTPVSKVYEFEPVPQELSGEERRYIKGAQGNVWTEYIKNPEHVEYMAYPRATALAEVLWSAPEQKNYDNFLDRLKFFLPRLDAMNVNYAKHIFEIRGIAESDGKGGMQVRLSSRLDGGKITYTTDSSAPSSAAAAYNGPVAIKRSGTIRAAVFKDGRQYGNEYTQIFNFHKAVGKKITLAQPPHQQYNPGSAMALVNGIEGAKEFNDDQWTGYSGGQMEALIDLGDSIDITQVGINVLSAKDQWIYPPKRVLFEVSKDGMNFENIWEQKDVEGKDVLRLRHEVTRIRARYVKVIVQSAGTIPQDAPGAGNPAWLFADEIFIR